MKIDYKLTKLKNGMRVLLVPNKHVESVNVSIFFRVGSRCEDENIAGISHFLEHMFFKGTKKRPKAKFISEAIDSVGGEMNAFTSYEYTGYWIKVAKQHTDLAIDVLSDMIIDSKFLQKELDRERNVIKEEMKMYEDNPDYYIWRVWNKVLYGEQGLGREIAGTREALDNINHPEMIEYRNNYYSVANGLLVVVGNFVETSLMTTLNKYWNKVSKGMRSEYQLASDCQPKPQVELLTKDIQQANMCVGVRSYRSFHPDHFVVNLISVILGRGMSSRLFLRVREKHGLVYTIRAMADNYVDVGNLVVKTGCDANKAEQALKMILEEFKKLTKEKVLKKELDKAKEYWKGTLILSLEDLESVGGMVGMQELLFDKVVTPDQMIKAIDKVTAEDIMRVAKDMFKPEKLNLAVIGPFKNSKKFQTIVSNF